MGKNDEFLIKEPASGETQRLADTKKRISRGVFKEGRKETK